MTFLEATHAKPKRCAVIQEGQQMRIHLINLSAQLSKVVTRWWSG
jgi:hypothetical protein